MGLVRGRKGLLALLWGLLLMFTGSSWQVLIICAAEDVNGNSEEKHEAGKGDPSCQSVPKRIGNSPFRSNNLRSNNMTPCRDDDDEDNENTGGMGGVVNIGAPGSNYIYFDLFVALPPYQQSLGSILKVAVTAYLNITSDDYNYRIADQGYVQNGTTTNAPPEAPLAMWLLSLFDDIMGGRDVENKVADLFLVYYEPQTILTGDDKWWWKYTLKYKCFWVDSGLPITEQDMLLEIKSNTEKLLELPLQFLDLQKRILDWISQNYRISQNYQFIYIQLEDPRQGQATTEAPSSSPTAEIIFVNGTISPEPFGEFDSTEWDWRRYVGLGMLLGTVGSTLCFVVAANFRRSRRLRKELWGNLATEEGVNELLRKGWKIRDGKMEIFDKKGYGYAVEDGSMLMGGYQQSELVGTEISMMSQSPTSPRHSQRNSSSSHATP